jgi:hypothetical protein
VRGLASEAAVTDPADATLAAYQSRVQEYLRASALPASELIAYLDQFAGLARPGPVLEIGSGPGWDAGYLEDHGVRVLRTDATPAFVALLCAAGHQARLLDARTDPWAAPTRESWPTPYSTTSAETSSRTCCDAPAAQ